MDASSLPILIALTVALAAVGMWQLAQSVVNPDKRRLAERLSSEGKIEELGSTTRSITMQLEAEGFTAKLVRIGFFQRLYRRLLQAYPNMPLSRFLAIVMGLVIFLGGATFFVSGGLWIVTAVAAFIGGYIPFVILSAKRSRRQRTLALQLPEALDFLSRILKAGHSLSTGLQMMSEELPKPMAEEFRRAYDQHSLGLSMDDALKDMATRIESNDFAFFVTAVLIQRTTGGDLSEVLNNISGMIRQRIRLQQHVRAKTAEGRFTGYILSAFPGVMFVIAAVLNRQYAQVLWTTTSGLFLLGIAFGLTLIGLFCIKKITTVRV